MREGFIDHIVQQIKTEDLPLLASSCYIFPTRRAGLIFRNKLVNHFSDQTFWSPSVLSIEDFIIEHSHLALIDDLELIGKLFQCYKKYEKDLSLDEFYPWGQTLLKDFDEVDRYLRDGKNLYTNLKDLREIDSLFHADEEALGIIRQFRTITEQSKTEIFARFAETWNIVAKVYTEFRDILHKEEKGYPGLLYRTVADSDISSLITYRKLHFIGFNALSRSEEVIIEELVSADRAEVWWDLGVQVEHPGDPSNRFIQEYREKWKSDHHHWIEKEQSEQKIRIYSANGHVAQARTASKILSDSKMEWGDTAIVLADEQLLIPLLYSLPGEGDSINITMGYSIHSHPLVHFVKNYFSVTHSLSEQGGGKHCNTEILMEFLQNPYVKIIGRHFQYKVLDLIREKKWTWTPVQELESFLPEGFQDLFISDTPIPILKRVMIYVDRFHEFLKASDDTVEKEVLYVFRKHLNQFLRFVSPIENELNYEFLWKLLNESLVSVKVNFSGEPVSGLQVMGFLESRVLSFKNIILLSVNEGNIPRQRQQATYIPYSLRKAFGLPTFEERDAIYGYHMSRLLSHAEQIHILYNSELAYDGTGEMSRFVRKLISEGKKKNLDVQSFNAGSKPSVVRDIEPPTITKNRDVQTLLRNYTEGQTDMFQPVRQITPTALLTYMACKLKFYFQYVIRLKERREDLLEMEPRDFGNLFHKAMELIYQDYTGRILSSKDFEQLMSSEFIQDKVKTAFNEEFGMNELKGRNRFYTQVNEKLIKDILRKDSESPGLKISDVEAKSLNTILYPEPDLPVKVGGVVDRIDEVTNEGGKKLNRIIDYKTGIIKTANPKNQSPEDYLDEYFTNPKFKAGFQVYFYSYLFKLKYPDEDLVAGFYNTNKIRDGVKLLWSGLPMDEEFMKIFGSRIHSVLKEIFDPEISFEPVEDKSICTYCPYTSICLRHQKKPS